MLWENCDLVEKMGRRWKVIIVIAFLRPAGQNMDNMTTKCIALIVCRRSEQFEETMHPMCGAQVVVIIYLNDTETLLVGWRVKFIISNLISLVGVGVVVNSNTTKVKHFRFFRFPYWTMLTMAVLACSLFLVFTVYFWFLVIILKSCSHSKKYYKWFFWFSFIKMLNKFKHHFA